MAKLAFAMNMSLDGYVDHQKFAPSPPLFRHFIELVSGATGGIYGGRMYEIMRYWDQDQPDWDLHEREYAAAWRKQPKWVVSRTLKAVGPNATLINDDIEAAVRRLKTQHGGDIQVAGPGLAHVLGDLGLIDEYQIYLHPIVLGSGTPFFAGPRTRLHLVASEPIVEDVIKLSYVPA